MTIAAAEIMLEQDLGESEGHVARLVKVSLTDNEFSALVSFVFNCGVGNFASSTLLRQLNLDNREAVAGQFLKWVNAGGKPAPGLVRRRTAERALQSSLRLDPQSASHSVDAGRASNGPEARAKSMLDVAGFNPCDHLDGRGAG